MEPMAAITDLLVAAISFYAYFKLRGPSAERGYLREYPLFFLFMGAGTLCAAIMTHSFYYLFSEGIYDRHQADLLPWSERFVWHLHDLPNWLFNIISITFFEIATIKRSSQVLKDLPVRWLYMLIAAESAAAFVLTVILLTYNVAGAHIFFAMIVLSLPLQIRILSRERENAESKYILAATFCMIVALAVMATRCSIDRWFNFTDLAHCLIAVTMYLTYMSAKKTFERYH